MRRIRRYLSLLLVLALVFTFVPLPALAAETAQVRTAQGMRTNSVSKSTLTVEDAVRPEKSETVPHSDYLTDYSEAAMQLRADLTAREEWTTLYIRSTEDAPEPIVDALWAEAAAHTGNPVEGDYIDRQYDGFYWYAEWESDGQYNYYTLDFEMTYFTSAAQEAEMNVAVDELLNETLSIDSSMSDYEKLKLVYDWVCANVYYDYEHDDSYLPRHSAYAALVNRTSVCQGYAALLYRLLLTLGIDNRMVYGYTDDGEAHEWNIVELDGVYYNVDATWDASCAQSDVEYEWFLLSMDSFVDHNRDDIYTSAAFNSAYPMAAADYSAGPQTTPTPTPTPGSGCGMSEEEVYESIIALQDDYSEGMTWNNNNVYQWNINNTTGYGCAGFAFLVSDAAFGYLPSRTISTDITIDDLRVGDIIRMYNDSHSAVVLEVHDDYIVLVEGNYNDSIHWGRIMTAEEVIQDTTYVQTRYPAHTFENGVCIECGAVSDAPADPEPTPGQWPVTGICGGNTVWSLTEDGLLTISGTGSITDYLGDDPAWYAYADMITEVVIDEGVTRLGGYAFRDCANLAWVGLPSSITAVGENVFLNCGNLEGVFFTGDAPAFAYYAFNSNSTDCYYPANNETWTDDVLQNYGGNINWVPCDDSETPEVWIDDGICGDDLTWTLGVDGLLTISGSGDMWDYPEDFPGWYEYADQVTNVIIEEGVTSIGDFAFWDCQAINWVLVSSTVAQVGSGAFSRCYSLNTVDFMGEAPDFGDDAFYNVTAQCCYYAATGTWTDEILQDHGGDLTWTAYDLEPENWPVSGTCGDDLTWSLSEDGMLTISGTGQMWDYPEDFPGWYDYVDYLTDVVIEEGVTTIGDYAFWDCYNLSWARIPASVTYIGEGAFAYCYSLESVDFVGDAPEIHSNAFYDVTADCFYPAGNNTWTTVVTQQYSGTLNWVSYGSEDLTWPVTGTCGENVTWSLDENGLLTISGSGAMWNYPIDYPGWYAHVGILTEAVIEPGVTTIGDFAFYDCSNLQTVTIPDTVTSIGISAFNYAALTAVTIPDSVTYIGPAAFKENEMTTLTIPGSVELIDEYAFAECDDLTQIRFLGDAPQMGTNVFDYVWAECYYPANNATWTEDMFHDYGVGQIIWLSGETAEPVIPGGDIVASGECGDALTWTLNTDGLLTISGTGDMWDYDGMSGTPWDAVWQEIKTVVIEDGVTSVGDWIFSMCLYLTSVEIPGSVKTIGENAFSGLRALDHMVLREGLQEIGMCAFYGCIALTEMTIPASVSTIAPGAFGGCTGLTAIAVDPASQTFRAEDGVVYNMDMTELVAMPGGYDREYVLPESVTAIGWGDFYACTMLPGVILHDGVISIGQYAFYLCASLTSITIPTSVERFEAKVFQACSGLTEITFQGDAPAMGNEIFSQVEATAYYPADNASWTSGVMQNYGGTITWVPMEQTGTVGDVNGSGTVDSDDAIYLLYYTLFGDAMYPVDQDCDFNGSGTVDSDDAIYLLYYTLFGDALYPLN